MLARAFLYEDLALHGHSSLLDTLLAPVINWITATIQSLGHGGIVLLMAIESACIPLPSEIILPFSGFLVAKGVFNLHLAAAAGAFGCLFGSWVAYGVGYYGGRPFLERYGKYILISSHDMDLADRWFSKYGDGAIFVSRILPVVRTFISLPAGIARMPILRFSILSLVGSWLWSYALIYVGALLGEHWGQLRERAHGFDYLIAALLLIGIIVYVWRHVSTIRTNAKPAN